MDDLYSVLDLRHQPGFVCGYVFMFLSSGLGWILAGRHIRNSWSLTRRGIVTIMSATLMAVATVLSFWISVDITVMMGGIAFGLLAISLAMCMEAGWIRYPEMLGSKWRQRAAQRLITSASRMNLQRDTPEVLVVSCVWLLSSHHACRGIFTSPSSIFLNIAGAISIVRLVDTPAAIGIAATPSIRLACLWICRVAFVLAVVLRSVYFLIQMHW